MRREFKSKEGAILNETQQIFQLMNIADSLDELNKGLKTLDKTLNESLKLSNLIDIEEEETIAEKYIDPFVFYFLLIVLIIVMWVKL